MVKLKNKAKGICDSFGGKIVKLNPNEYCQTNITDKIDHLDFKALKKCSNRKIQHFYKCAGIKGGKCQCWTAFLQPLDWQGASTKCKDVDGSLVQGPSIELERFLEHLEKEKSIDIETDKKFIIKDKNYIDVNWSAESRKRANIETSEKIETGSFICVTNISDNTLNPIDFENLKLCKDKRIQKSYECIGNPRENCKCMTFFQGPLEKKEAIQQCQEMGGNLVNSGFKEQLEESYLDCWKNNSGEKFKENKHLIFGDDQYAEIDWSRNTQPQVIVKSTNNETKGSFICSTEIRDEYSQVDFKELKKCFNKKIQKSYECIGNPRENCKCMTFLQGPLEKKEAIQHCQEMDGNLVDIGFKQKLEESYLDYWKNNSGEKFKENTDLIFKNDEYAEINWSNPKTPQVDIKSINKKMKGSFICSTEIKDDLSHVDLTELKKCSNSKIQHFYKCAGIKGGKCQCWTAFLKPLNWEDASKECDEVEGSLVQGPSIELERFLEHLEREKSIDIETDKNYIDVKWSAESTKRANIETSKKIEEGSFICVTNISDNPLNPIDFENLKLCKDKRIQKSYECIGNPRENCKCMTFFQGPLEKKEAIQQCQEMGGNLVDIGFKQKLEESYLDYWKNNSGEKFKENKHLIFGDDQYAEIDWSRNTQPQVIVKSTNNETKGSFICSTEIRDEYSQVDFKELKKCFNKKIQKSYECIGNPRENCKCMTFFQGPLEKKEAIQQCQEMDGNLVDIGFKQKLEESYLDYWKNNSGEKFKENTDLIFKNDEYAEINWSNPKTPQVDIKSINKKMKGSFICSTEIKDDLSHVDLTELKKCSISKIQHFYKCAGIKGGKCQCWTAFLKPLNWEDASKECNEVEGSLVQGPSIELERFLEHLEREKSIDIETDKNYIDVKWSAESTKRANIETSKKIEERSFICVTNISDNPLNPIDFENLKLCKDKRIQKSYECIGNPRENCKCMTFFQGPLEKKEAIQQCQEMGGNLVDIGFKQKLEESYLDYWKNNSGEKFKENKHLIFGDDQYAEIDWSRNTQPQVIVKSTNNETKGSFICSTEIRDEYS
ncbi:hypothetical protein QYM36_002610 [Artemia franciscana]|uniref:Uncharacterized protein n=1 Tax=Artemia franciscana TaxID=6661 RepID=A0AA88L892_ARTSF|nr:hypothetical protein QYM36_002610 [Artemia franciscana]